ncbi:acetyltransferase [Legionella norrlandica]|uniref:Acetyltransferase n=1 Tax=Legionella norrlandica TaxID=1498499 RepID=A0A0A2SSW5_9GAMM|nr:acyltransferase family protein [Legionella norrlandica]KGP64225.1 acetyltransferase [Legionella norrlandica]
MNYRSDIDGLRAIAILFVLFFHSGLSLFPSGFIGVDIFFVISGFLITSIIQKSLQNNHFSFVEFYSRRLWRLQPVFICLIVVTTLVALFYYLPDDLLLFSKSARKTSIFTSNVFFKNVTSNYFSPDSNQLPLLHMWSLSIEWQCYLILPVAIYLLHRLFGHNHMTKVIYLLAIGFLSLSMYYSWSNPAKTYYQLTSRIFEFLIGACVTLGSNRFLINKSLLNAISILAIITLFYIAMHVDVNAGYPNWYTLILCLATAVLIAVGRQEPKLIASQVLSLKPLVFIGLISYSLYIWHWPLFALIRYLNIEESNLVLLLTFGIVFIIAYLSWQFIEKPARKLHQIKFGYTVACLFILPVIVTHLCDHLIKKNIGYPHRFKEAAQIYVELNKYKSVQRPLCLERKSVEVDNQCVLGAQNSGSHNGFMIGDSYSNQYWRFMDTFAKKANVSILAHATVACLALPGIYQFDVNIKNKIYQECHDQTDRYFNMIKANHYDYVILGQNWNGYLGDKIINQLNDVRSQELSQKRIEKALDEALQIITASGAKPVLIKSIALSKGNPYSCFFEHIKLRKKYNPEQCDFKLDVAEQRWIDTLFTKMGKKYSQLIIIDPRLVQCPSGVCRVAIHDVPVFRDSGHITDYASYHLAQLYLQKNKNPLVI